jgi:hypothetical protein
MKTINGTSELFLNEIYSDYIYSSNLPEITGQILQANKFNQLITKEFLDENIENIQLTQGPQGIDGIDGTNGTNGTNGSDGSDGINGSNGTNGSNGSDGINGIDGIDGIDGITPIFNIGTVIIADPPTVEFVQDVNNNNIYNVNFGLKTGEQGSIGPAGNDAITPIFNVGTVIIADPPTVEFVQDVNDNNIYNVNFGLKTGAQGGVGARGSKGNTGDKGETGDKGDVGDTSAIPIASLALSEATLAIGIASTSLAASTANTASIVAIQAEIGIIQTELSQLEIRTTTTESQIDSFIIPQITQLNTRIAAIETYQSQEFFNSFWYQFSA